jgi:hypothetical protein
MIVDRDTNYSNPYPNPNSNPNSNPNPNPTSFRDGNNAAFNAFTKRKILGGMGSESRLAQPASNSNPFNVEMSRLPVAIPSSTQGKVTVRVRVWVRVRVRVIVRVRFRTLLMR